jgi:hypothetical protein
VDDKKSKEYLEHALHCREMAEWRTLSSELRTDWLRLADKWLAMVPGAEQINSTVKADTPAEERSKVPHPTKAGVRASSA